MIGKGSTREAQFVERVEALDAGRLAALRRGCGERDPVEGRCPWLVALIQGAADESTAFLTASLLAQYSTAVIKSGRHRARGNFADTWKAAVAGRGSDSIKRRFHILLDAEYDPFTGDGDLPYRLRQMVRYAAGRGVGVDWPVLLADLKYWNHPEKPVQKRWARSFFSADAPDPSDERE